jgi:hypothetical protein
MPFTITTPIQINIFDFPNVRPAGDGPVGDGKTPFQLAPIAGYQGVIALTPTLLPDDSMEVALYVDKDVNAGAGISWTATTAARIIDVPIGFNIGNGPAIQSWINRFPSAQSAQSAQRAQEEEERARRPESSAEKRHEETPTVPGPPTVPATGHP